MENFFEYLICVGGAALIVRAHGAGDTRRMSRIFSHCLTCCVLLGATFTAIYGLCGAPMAKMVAGETAMADYARELLSWERPLALVSPIQSFLFTFVLYMGGSGYCAAAITALMGSNLALSLYFGKTIGIGGVPFATGCANAIGIAILCLFFVFRKPPVRVRPYLSLPYLKRITVLGAPESSFILAISFMEAAINARAVTSYGIQGVNVAAVAIDLFEVILFVSEGISEYETVSLNEYIGRQDRRRIRSCIRTTVRAAVCEGLVFCALYLLGAGVFVDLFDLNDPLTVRLAARAVRVVAAVAVAICLTRVLAIFYQYTERIARAAALLWLAWGIFPAALGWTIGAVFLDGITVGLAAGSALALVAMLTYVRLVRHEGVWDVPDRVFER